MSQEDVSLVRHLYEVVPNMLDADPSVVDRVLREYVDEHFEVQLPSEYPEGEQVHRGREGMDAMVATFREAWSEWRFLPERFLDAQDHVVVFVRVVAVGHESGVPIELEAAHVWTIRNGRARSMRVYRKRSAALEAVGLRE